MIKFVVEVEPDSEGWRVFYKEYRGLFELDGGIKTITDEVIKAGLIREMIATWEFQGLVDVVSIDGKEVY